jgi:hypothetical protein
MCTPLMFGSFASLVLVAVLSQTGFTASIESTAPFGVRADVARTDPVPSAFRTTPPARRSPALTGLYVSFAGLEALDVHSTLRAIENGGVESNPAIGGVASNSASLIAVKAATGGAVIWMAEKIRKQHPTVAMALMAGLNSAMAIVVAHNYSIR